MPLSTLVTTDMTGDGLCDDDNDDGREDNADIVWLFNTFCTPIFSGRMNRSAAQ